MKVIRAPKYGNRELRDFEVKRYEELIMRYKQLTGQTYQGEIINMKSKETLMDIACSKGRFEDVSKYHLKKLDEKRKKQGIENVVHKEEDEKFEEFCEFIFGVKDFFKQLLDVIEVGEENIDMIRAEKIYHEAFELMKSRNVKYGDSWKVLSIQSLANLCEMKLHRIANLDKLEPKIYDEMIDTLNYMVFGILKLKEKDLGVK